MKKDQIYQETFTYAREHGEVAEYRASMKLNMACRDAIDKAIAENFDGYRLSKNAIQQVAKAFSYDRIFYVLANTVKLGEHDGRYSRQNKEWARTFPTDAACGTDFALYQSHPGVINIFINQVRREHLLSLPLKQSDIKAEAENLMRQFQEPQKPNSPDKAHFVAKISPDFIQRAKPKDMERLAAMFPFPSFSIPQAEEYRDTFAQISANEDRSQKLQLRKPFVRKKLQETQPAPKPPAKRTAKEQER